MPAGKEILPIVVKSKAEWDKIAPVLENRGKEIAHHFDSLPTQHDPFKGDNTPIVIWFCTARWIEYDWYNTDNYPNIQSVDDYLNSLKIN